MSRIDDAYLEAAGPAAPDRRQLRRRGEQHRPRRGPPARDRDLEHAGRADRRHRRGGADVDAVAAAEGDRGRPPHPPARAVGVLARVHARREPRREDGADRRCGADRPRDRAARRGVRRACGPRRPRRRPRCAPAAGRHRLDPRPADGGDAPPDRRPPARADAADRRADQHRPRPRRRRGRAGRGARAGHDRRRRARRLRARAGGRPRSCSGSRTSSSRRTSAAPRATRALRWGCSASAPSAPCCSRAARRPTSWGDLRRADHGKSGRALPVRLPPCTTTTISRGDSPTSWSASAPTCSRASSSA